MIHLALWLLAAIGALWLATRSWTWFWAAFDEMNAVRFRKRLARDQSEHEEWLRQHRERFGKPQ